ncbi:hypothetical protein Tco_0322787 [Tanacetum coccineum]
MSTSSNSQMHNDIMAAGSKEHPLMLSLGPHIMTEITHSETPKDGDRARVPGYTEKGIYSNTDPENMKLIDAEVENKGKEIVKPPTPPSKSASKEDIDEEQAQEDKTVIVDGNRETIGNQVVQQSGIQWFNYKRFGHFTIECKKPKKVKDYEYHKEKMMLCKQESKCIPLSAEQNEWIQDIDEEAYEQELETNYMYIEKIQEVLHAIDNNSGPTYDTEPLEKVYTDDDYNLFATERQHSMQPESINDTYVVETVDSNVNPDLTNMCNNEGKDDQNAKEPENERSLINTSLILNIAKFSLRGTNQKDKEATELKCKEALDLLACNTHKNAESLKIEAYRMFLVKEENAKLVNQISMQERQISNIEKENDELKKDFKEREDKDINKQIALENQVKILSNTVYKTSQSAQTVFMLTPKPSSYYNGRCLISFENPKYLKIAQWERPCLYNVQYDKNDLANMFAPESEETIQLQEKSRSKLDNIKSIVETDWQQCKIDWQNPITHEINLLVHDMLILLAHKTLKNVEIFENALKEEMLKDLKYVKSVEKELNDLKMELDDLKSQLEHEQTDFLTIDDLLLQDFFSRDFVCVIILSLDDIDEYFKMACNILRKLKNVNEKEKTVCEKSWVKQSFTSENNDKVLKVKNDSLIVEINRKTIEINDLKAQLQDKTIVNAEMRVIHNTSVSRPQFRSTQMKDKVMPNNSQVMIKKKKVEDHHRISSFSNKTKSITVCNDNLNAKTSNAKVVCVAYDKFTVPDTATTPAIGRDRTYDELTDVEKIREGCDIKATNIERESKLYDEFDMFTLVPCETIHPFYLRFAQLINDMHSIGMTMIPIQINTKFINLLQPEWSKFITDVKLAKDLYITNFDHLYGYLRQHKAHAEEVRLTRQRYSDPIALVANTSNSSPSYSNQS